MATEQKQKSAWSGFKNPFEDIFNSFIKKTENREESHTNWLDEDYPEEKIEIKIKAEANNRLISEESRSGIRSETQNQNINPQERQEEKQEVVAQQKNNSPTSPPIIDFTIKRQQQ